ncbi:MAG TPA: DUF3291 domain-containing protein [Dehalococcoidia bacterium]|nr:DUF3291 domain-containing protein [Dehalococcoidia bacterium]
MAYYHLAQINAARANAAFDSPDLAEFIAQVEDFNAPADGSRGFVWRLQTPEGNATGIRINEDKRLFVNLTVWESMEALREYAFQSGHMDVMRRRREWFVPYGRTTWRCGGFRQGCYRPSTRAGAPRIHRRTRGVRARLWFLRAVPARRVREPQRETRYNRGQREWERR